MNSHGICYVTGPVSGHPEGNMPAFERAALVLAAEGWTVTRPRLNLDAALESQVLIDAGKDHTQGPLYQQVMRQMFGLVLQAEQLFCLPGWRKSRGARDEVYLAQRVGIPINVYHDDPAQRLPVSSVLVAGFTHIGLGDG